MRLPSVSPWLRPVVRTVRDFKWKRSAAVVFMTLCLGLLAIFLLLPPFSFPLNTPVTIESGMSANQVADLLKEKDVVRSSEMLYLALVLFYNPEEIKAGSYVFYEPVSLLKVAARITDDTPDIEHVVLTFFEGTSVEKYAATAAERLAVFDSDYFFQNALRYEGFLFPDTYYVPYAFTADELIGLLNKTYLERTQKLFANNSTGLTEYETITLASILEREGDTDESMRIIAGILLNRLAADMPLQVDATMEYVIGKPLDELTSEDLAIDSPYNTYLYRGLPPTPIGNPGLAAISAALNPQQSAYLYYLTGNDGTFYYAETYDEHLDNIERYLR